MQRDRHGTASLVENRKNPALAHAFGSVLIPARKAARMTQRELAARAGISKTHVEMLERGRRVPTLTVLFVLATVVRIKPEHLVSQTRTAMRKTRKGRAKARTVLNASQTSELPIKTTKPLPLITGTYLVNSR